MTERKWIAIQHVPFEKPGLIATLAARRGLPLDTCHPYRGEHLPSLHELAGLVIMGGPMGVTEDIEHPHLRAELELLATAVEAGLPVLGVCLGAQLLAHTLGAAVYPGERPEIGTGTIELTSEGQRDPVLGATGAQSLTVMHWHGETFDIPSGAERLAGSELYPNQAFRFGDCTYGLQFHVEVDERLASAWRAHLPPDITIPEHRRAAIERTGIPILAAFFDLACSRYPPDLG